MPNSPRTHNTHKRGLSLQMEQQDYELTSYSNNSISNNHSRCISKAIHRPSNQVRCIKSTDAILSFQSYLEALNEARMLREVGEHDNIISFYHAFQNETSVRIVTEYCDGGDLYNLLQERGEDAFTEEEARHLFSQLIEALQYCHSRYIAHRDVKLENIGLVCDPSDKKNVLKMKVRLLDFGFGCHYLPGRPLNQRCGTIDYAAPELLSDQTTGYNPELVDIWSAGCVLYLLTCGRFPFVGSSLKELSLHILNDKPRKIPSFLSPSLHRLLGSMLEKDPKQRIASFREVQSSEWLSAQ